MSLGHAWPVLGALFLGAGAAPWLVQAEPIGRSCAIVQPTPSGFLAIRSGPGMEHHAVFRVRPGQLLGLDEAFPVGGTDWRQVRRIAIRHPDGRIEIVRHLDGWIDGRYVKAIDCQPQVPTHRAKRNQDTPR